MATSTLKGMGIVTATFKDDFHLQLEEWDGSHSLSYLLTISICADRSRVVPPSASGTDGDSQLHLERDGVGHHHLQRDDDPHLQPEHIGMAHIFRYTCLCCRCVYRE